MLRILLAGAFLLLSSPSRSNEADVCSSSADETDGGQQVRFLGPSNSVWSYLSADPRTWRFKVEAESGKSSSPRSIMMFAPWLGINEDWTKFFTASKDGTIAADPSQVKAFMTRLNGLFTKKDGAFPRPIVELHFAFKGGLQQCTLGLGPNSLTVSVPRRRDWDFIRRHKIHVNVRNPKGLEKFPTTMNKDNQFVAAGLPMGEYAPELVYDSPEISGGYGEFDPIAGLSAGAHCAVSIEQRERRDWILVESGCSSSKR